MPQKKKKTWTGIKLYCIALALASNNSLAQKRGALFSKPFILMKPKSLWDSGDICPVQCFEQLLPGHFTSPCVDRSDRKEVGCEHPGEKKIIEHLDVCQRDLEFFWRLEPRVAKPQPERGLCTDLSAPQREGE